MLPTLLRMRLNLTLKDTYSIDLNFQLSPDFHNIRPSYSIIKNIMRCLAYKTSNDIIARFDKNFLMSRLQ